MVFDNLGMSLNNQLSFSRITFSTFLLSTPLLVLHQDRKTVDWTALMEQHSIAGSVQVP